MTGVTHGADVDRLREVAGVIRGQGQRVQEVGDELGPLSAMLEESWGGPDAEALLVQVHRLRPAIAGAGATLVAWADGLSAQADQQASGSGESGGSGGSGQGIRDAVREGARLFGGLSAPGGAPTGGTVPGWQGGNPLANSATAYQHSADGGGGGVSDIDGGTSGRDPGQIDQPGSVSKSTSVEAGPVKVTDTATASVSGESVDAEGRSMQTTEVTLSREGAIELGKKIDGVGVTGTGYTGAEVGYSVTAPAGVDPLSIDPLRPETWPEGVSVRFDESFYAGYGLEGNYRGLIVGIGQEVGTGQYIEVSKGDGNEVTVLVGNDEFRRATTQLGVGTDELNAKVGANNGISSGSAREVVIDRSTPAGQATYESLLFGGGAVPAVGTAGVVDVADLTVMNAQASVDISGTAGDWSAGGTLSEWSAGGVQRTHDDGTTTLDWTGESKGVQTGGTAYFDEAGNPVPEKGTYYVRLEGVDPQAANDFNQYVRGSSTQVDAEQNVVLTYTHDDLQTMRMQAAETQATMINADPERYNYPEGTRMTAEDVIATVEADPDTGIFDVTDGAESNGTRALLGAGSDAEIMRVIAQDPLGVSQGVSLDHHTATGELATPTGEVASHESAT